MLGLIARDPQAFIRQQGWASVFSMVARPRRRPHDKARRKLEKEIVSLQAVAERVAEEARGVAGDAPF